MGRKCILKAMCGFACWKANHGLVACKIVGKTEELDKLTGSLLVDSSKIRNLLGWKAPFTLDNSKNMCKMELCIPD